MVENGRFPVGWLGLLPLAVVAEIEGSKIAGMETNGVEAEDGEMGGVEMKGVEAEGMETEGVKIGDVEAEGMETEGVEVEGTEAIVELEALNGSFMSLWAADVNVRSSNAGLMVGGSLDGMYSTFEPVLGGIGESIVSSGTVA